MRIIYSLALTATFVVLTATTDSPVQARRMERVLQECEKQQAYPEYAACVRERYSKVGNNKKSGPVFAFYALLEEIGEVYTNAKEAGRPMTEAKARSNVYRAWQSTIEASNVAETGKICSMSDTTLVCN